MDQLTQTTVGHHQPKYSVEELKQYQKSALNAAKGAIPLACLL
jgi:hypothetical protein